MKMSRIADRLERASEVVFSEEWQARFFARVFGVLGVACLVGAQIGRASCRERV